MRILTKRFVAFSVIWRDRWLITDTQELYWSAIVLHFLWHLCCSAKLLLYLTTDNKPISDSNYPGWLWHTQMKLFCSRGIELKKSALFKCKDTKSVIMFVKIIFLAFLSKCSICVAFPHHSTFKKCKFEVQYLPFNQGYLWNPEKNIGKTESF